MSSSKKSMPKRIRQSHSYSFLCSAHVPTVWIDSEAQMCISPRQELVNSEGEHYENPRWGNIPRRFWHERRGCLGSTRPALSKTGQAVERMSGKPAQGESKNKWSFSVYKRLSKRSEWRCSFGFRRMRFELGSKTTSGVALCWIWNIGRRFCTDSDRGGIGGWVRSIQSRIKASRIHFCVDRHCPNVGQLVGALKRMPALSSCLEWRHWVKARSAGPSAHKIYHSVSSKV